MPNKRKVYYGPKGHEMSMYWEVVVARAKSTVTLPGPISQGRPGTNIGCAISKLAVVHPEAFPHKVFLISVIKDSLLAVDKLNRAGQPCHAIWYKNPYNWLVDANDDRIIAKLLKDNPRAFDGPFIFSTPRKQKKSGERTSGGGHGGGAKTPFIPRGCLARAMRAGLVDPVAMKQMQKAMAA